MPLDLNVPRIRELLAREAAELGDRAAELGPYTRLHLGLGPPRPPGIPAEPPRSAPAPAPSPEPPLPSLGTMARNVAGAAVRHVAAGMPRASPEAVSARLTVCESCPLW